FACHILANLPRFHRIYNDCVQEYRRVNGIRSRNHPVPDLKAEGDWLETPFWAWDSDEPHMLVPTRGRLYFRSTGTGTELRSIGTTLPLSSFEDNLLSRSIPPAVVAAWLSLEESWGFK